MSVVPPRVGIAAGLGGDVVLASGVLVLAVVPGEDVEMEVSSLDRLAEGRILLTCQRGEGEKHMLMVEEVVDWV